MSPVVCWIYRSKRNKGALLFALIFFIFISSSNYAAESPIWNNVERIVSIADIHGSFDNLTAILRGTKIVDHDLNWIGGKTHLVQTGDIMDRGPDAKKVFDLFMKLEKQAKTAGGKVHVLLGNHDVMNLSGIALQTVGYVTLEQFFSFLPEKFINRREREIKNKLSKSEIQLEKYPAEVRRYWLENMQTDMEARSEYMSFLHKRYGSWLLEKNLVIKINDIIFTHGGVNEEFSTWKLKKINSRLRKEILAIKRGNSMTLKIVYQADAPQWFRGMILKNEEDFSDDVDRILNNLKSNYMVVGHTVRQKELLNKKKLDRFQGRIWGMDTGISEYYGGNISALIIDNGIFKVWWSSNEKAEKIFKISIYRSFRHQHVF